MTTIYYTYNNTITLRQPKTTKKQHVNNQKRQKNSMTTMRTVLAFAVSLRVCIVDHTWKKQTTTKILKYTTFKLFL